jgi:hypothetical protein
MSTPSTKWGLLLVVPLVVLPAGCGVVFPPPPEAVLEGTWEVTSSSSLSLTQLLLTFDQNGDLTRVTYKLGTEVTITAPSPSGTSTVSGKDVTIAATFLGNSLIFNGTLNDSDTVINGTLTTQITVGLIVVTINNGPGTFTKQP